MSSESDGYLIKDINHQLQTPQLQTNSGRYLSLGGLLVLGASSVLCFGPG